jgi:hypothetical protein
MNDSGSQEDKDAQRNGYAEDRMLAYKLSQHSSYFISLIIDFYYCLAWGTSFIEKIL